MDPMTLFLPINDRNNLYRFRFSCIPRKLFWQLFWHFNYRSINNIYTMKILIFLSSFSVDTCYRNIYLLLSFLIVRYCFFIQCFNFHLVFSISSIHLCSVIIRWISVLGPLLLTHRITLRDPPTQLYRSTAPISNPLYSCCNSNSPILSYCVIILFRSIYSH